MDGISENIFNEDLDKLFLVNFNLEKIISEWVHHEDPEFVTKKFRICIIRAATRAWTSKTTIIGRCSLDTSLMYSLMQVMDYEYICVTDCG